MGGDLHDDRRALGVERGDVLAIETAAGRVEVPALPRGGIRDDVIAIAIGQGHTAATTPRSPTTGVPARRAVRA